jgi:hypothetical protein
MWKAGGALLGSLMIKLLMLLLLMMFVMFPTYAFLGPRLFCMKPSERVNRSSLLIALLR